MESGVQPPQLGQKGVYCNTQSPLRQALFHTLYKFTALGTPYVTGTIIILVLAVSGLRHGEVK